MSTLVFVDAEISTQADGTQSSRVPIPLPEDPYEAIRQAYLVRTNTESEPFEGEAETPESRHTVAPPTFPSLRRNTRMVICVPSAMSPGFSISIAEVAAMSDSAFHKRFRSSYDSSPSPNFPVQKRYKGTSELILDTNSEEDEEVKESSDSNSESEDVEDEGPTKEDEDPATPPSPEWLSGSLPISSEPFIVPSPISSPMISLIVPSPVASSATTEAEGFLTELGAQVKMQEGLISNHMVRSWELPPALFERYDRDIWELFTRPMLALEAWAEQGRIAARATGDERSCYCFGADPYEAIRQAYLVRTDTESEPFEGEAETPESPHTVAPPTCVTTYMAVRVSPTMSHGLSVSISEVTAMSDLVFRKRFRSSYDSSPSPTYPVRKRYRGTSELILDTDSEEDEEVEESSDSNSKSKDAEDEGPTAEDEDPAVGDEGLIMEDEGPSVVVERLDLGGEEAIHEGQQRAAPVVETTMSQSSRFIPESERLKRVSALRQPTLTTWIDLKDGIAYIDVPAYHPPALPVQTPPSLKWSSSSILVSLTPSIVPSPISSPMISLIVPSPVASLATAEAEGFLTEFKAQVKMQGGLIRDHMEMTDSTFGALWRPVLELEAWRELQEMRGRVTALEQEKDRKER
uniref:Uncharacterized protein n=1 Tax=Tanacetum cinerariifolium TaxID=118510 RepID=A0A6L2KNB6_TANCI|nr:hypothetical protein [Tanacetum cinerariifolium]